MRRRLRVWSFVAIWYHITRLFWRKFYNHYLLLTSTIELCALVDRRIIWIGSLAILIRAVGECLRSRLWSVLVIWYHITILVREEILQHLLLSSTIEPYALVDRRVIWIGSWAFSIRNITVTSAVGARRVYEKTIVGWFW